LVNGGQSMMLALKDLEAAVSPDDEDEYCDLLDSDPREVARRLIEPLGMTLDDLSPTAAPDDGASEE
jgi:hypothetical protein